MQKAVQFQSNVYITSIISSFINLLKYFLTFALLGTLYDKLSMQNMLYYTA